MSIFQLENALPMICAYSDRKTNFHFCGIRARAEPHALCFFEISEGRMTLCPANVYRAPGRLKQGDHAKTGFFVSAGRTIAS
jgi:hypothetical protein